LFPYTTLFRSTALTKTLEREGIRVSYQDDWLEVSTVFQEAGAETLIVYTPAIPKTLGLKACFQDGGHRLYKRSEVLGIISQSRFTIAIASTHGKTTTSTK